MGWEFFGIGTNIGLEREKIIDYSIIVNLHRKEVILAFHLQLAGWSKDSSMIYYLGPIFPSPHMGV